MIIVDIETSGLDPSKHAILSIGAVDFDSGEEFYQECRASSSDELDDIALAINGFTKEQALDRNKPSQASAYLQFLAWTKGRNCLLAGQQVGAFDIKFLKHHHDSLVFSKHPLIREWPFGYRSLDLHSVAFVKFKKSLNLDGILIELGLEPEPKPHNALNGARLEAQAFKLLLK